MVALNVNDGHNIKQWMFIINFLLLGWCCVLRMAMVIQMYAVILCCRSRDPKSCFHWYLLAALPTALLGLSVCRRASFEITHLASSLHAGCRKARSVSGGTHRSYFERSRLVRTVVAKAYLIFVTGTTGGACVKNSVRCKIFQI